MKAGAGKVSAGFEAFCVRTGGGSQTLVSFSWSAGGVKVAKTDSEAGAEPQGDASLDGASFSVVNETGRYVLVGGKYYADGEVCATIKTAPEDGSHVAETGADALPTGNYRIVESGAPEGFISMHPDTLALIVEGKAAKGDVLACARVAGVMAAKQTSTLIPMCHPLNITKAKVECEPVHAGEREDGRVGIHVTTTTGVTGKTGIEMEALTAASVACLTIYDMCKAVDRGMEIMDVRLLLKDGGKTGLWTREEQGE